MFKFASVSLCYFMLECFIHSNALAATVVVPAQVQAPFQLTEQLYQTNQANTLGLDYPQNIAHVRVFKAQQNSAQYNHGAVLFAFKNQLYAQWQSASKDEDGADTKVLYSISADGSHWSNANTLATSTSEALITNGGWWSDGKTLVSYFNVWPHQRSPKGGYVEYKTSDDGLIWSAAKRLRLKNNEAVEGIIEQDLKRSRDNTVLTALHTHPGLIAKPFYTQDPLGVSGWVIADMPNLPFAKVTSREIEPSWFMREDQRLVMIFRDQASSFKVLASVSENSGKTWSLPQITNMPDARAKLSAGNLPNGWAYIINCPSGSKQRMPLVLTLSKNGQLFDQAYLLGEEQQLPPLKFAGKYKRLGYSYPKSIIWQDALWVSYALNKEDIMVSKVPLTSLYQK